MGFRWMLSLMVPVLMIGCAVPASQSDRKALASPPARTLPDETGNIATMAGEPRALYRDKDSASRASMNVDTHARALRLRQELATNPKDVSAHVELAYLYSLQGNRVAMEGHFTRAKRIAGMEKNYPMLRRALWSEGWSQFNLGEYAAALRSWKVSTLMHGGAPYWQPYSYAVALWAAGERAVAVRWYDAAVRSDPKGWGTEKGMLRKTDHWKPRELEVVKELFAAYTETALHDTIP